MAGEYHSTRRNAFGVEPSSRPMPSKALAPERERIKPSVSRDMAEIAEHLSQNPVFVDLFGALRRETVDKLTASPLGPEGASVRELARYELEALSTIESRITAMASEIRLYDEAE